MTHPITTVRSLLLIAWSALTVFTLWDSLSHLLEGQASKQQMWNSLSTNHEWVLLSCVLLAMFFASYAVRIFTGMITGLFMTLLFFGISHYVENKLSPTHIVTQAAQKCAPSLTDLAVKGANKEGIPTEATAKVGSTVHHYSVQKSSNGNFSLVDQATGKVLNLAGCQ